MSDDELDGRLAAASERLGNLANALLAGGPWPLAVRIDHTPEAVWGPREVLAHLEEMLPYWLGEVERILESTDDPAAFGRTATDDVRLRIIERDRTLPPRELVARAEVGIERWRRRWAELDEGDRLREGTHAMLGRMTTTDVASRFAVGHLEEHLVQLAAVLDGDTTGG
jgi:hypothetical protein